MVGYNAEGNFFENHPSSGFATVAETISCGVNQERRRKRQNDQFSCIQLRLPADPDDRNRATACLSRYQRDVLLHEINATELAGTVEESPCPRNRYQAMADAARFIMHTESPLCYVSSLSRSSNIARGLTISATQQCCYDDDGWAHYKLYSIIIIMLTCM